MSPSVSRELARVLAAPHLEKIVPTLRPETLHQLIRHGGLEACTDLVALATPGQLTSVLDIDLWQRPDPGHVEQFDAVRFGEWIEVLIDASPSLAARTVAELDRALIVTGLSRFIRVFDPSATAPFTSFDGEQVGADADPDTGTSCDVGGYRVRAILTEGWDAIVTLLVALDAEHADCFHAVMRGCRRLSDSAPEIDGLDVLLSAPVQVMHDVSADRDDRRTRQGYSSVPDAQAFLLMARHAGGGSDRVDERHPIVTAYLRANDTGTALPEGTESTAARRVAGSLTDRSDEPAYQAIAELIAAGEAIPARPHALLIDSRHADDNLRHLRELLAHTSRHDQQAYDARMRELAFLANALVAGCSFQGGTFTPNDASAAAAAVCNLGLECWHDDDEGIILAAERRDLIVAFERGWTTLHDEVSMFTARRLLDVLSGVHAGDTETHAGLAALRRELVRCRTAGTPWKARDALDVVAVLDVPAWTGLLGLTDECPTIPAIVDAVVEGRTGAVNPRAFMFISTRRQIERAHAFIDRLSSLLSG